MTLFRVQAALFDPSLGSHGVWRNCALIIQTDDKGKIVSIEYKDPDFRPRVEQR